SPRGTPREACEQAPRAERHAARVARRRGRVLLRLQRRARVSRPRRVRSPLDEQRAQEVGLDVAVEGRATRGEEALLRKAAGEEADVRLEEDAPYLLRDVRPRRRDR